MLSAAFLKPYIPVSMRLQLIKVARDQEVFLKVWKAIKSAGIKQKKTGRAAARARRAARWLAGR